MTPKTTREHIISLQGNITGLEDIDKLGGKVDKIYWVLLGAVGAAVLTLLEAFIT